MEEEARGLTPSDEGKRRPWEAGSVHPFVQGEGLRAAAPGAATQLTQWR
jgi:hypothetical protein